MQSDHVGTEALSALLDGHLSDRERETVEAHLAGCPACRIDLEQLRRTVSLLQAMPAAAPARSFAVREAVPPARVGLVHRMARPPLLRALAGAAAALMVVVLLADAAWPRGDVTTGIGLSSPAMLTARESSASTPTVNPAAASAPPPDARAGDSGAPALEPAIQPREAAPGEETPESVATPIELIGAVEAPPSLAPPSLRVGQVGAVFLGILAAILITASLRAGRRAGRRA
ncbi:MAG: hypothetical protein GEU73_15790 [Chloroflexi bacterium]|nr:hypothetical protein [Chloroflexota bacterium]